MKSTKAARSYRGGGQYHEVAQLAAGYLDESTDIVFVSLGGNDARFSDVLTFVDTWEALRNEGPCTGGSRQAINSFTAILTPGDDKGPSAESFHPNERGTQLYADTIDTSLNWL
jgi:hypothetical protein